MSSLFARLQLRPDPVALRFVPFYIGINLIGGVHLLFFPVWLASIGLDAPTIGALMAAMGLLRVFSGPALGIAADAFHARRAAIICLMGTAAVSYSGYAALTGFAFVVLFSLTSSASFSAIGPILEGVTLKAALVRGFDYGRVRLWGSSAFIVMNLAGGSLIAANGIGIFPAILIAAGTFSFAASWLLPREGAALSHLTTAEIGRQAVALARRPLFWLFVATAGVAQACHSFYYAFGTLNWKAQGFSGDLIGLLWAIGVIAEIVLFSYSSRVVARLGPTRLLAIGTATGLVRWTITAFSPPLWLLVPVQCLHAGTFCAAHLGAMHFILRATPPHLVGTAQSIYSAATIGVFFSAGQFASGLLFHAFGGMGYLAMTGMSALALGLAVVLHHAWNGGTLLPEPVAAPAVAGEQIEVSSRP